MSGSIYKQNIITITRLITLQSFAKKTNLLKPALNNLLYIYKVYIILLYSKNQKYLSFTQLM